MSKLTPFSGGDTPSFQPFETGTITQKPLTPFSGDGLDPLRHTLVDSLKKTPERATRVLQLQLKTGLPSDLIDRNFDQIDTEVARKDFNAEEFRRKSPLVSSWLTANPQHAALAKDDLGPLTTLEWLTAGVRSLASGAYRTVPGVLGLLETVSKIPIPSEGNLIAEDPIDYEALMRMPAGLESPVSRVLEDRRRMTEAAMKTIEGRYKERVGPFGQSVLGGIGSVGQVLSAAPLGPTGVLGVMGASTAGQSATRATDVGLHPAVALAYGSFDGAVEVGTELIPVSLLFKQYKLAAPFWKTLTKQLAAEIPGEQVATALQDLSAWAVLPENEQKTFRDYLGERPSAAAQTLVATIVGTVGQAGIVRTASRAFGNKPIEQTVIEQLGKGVSESKTFQRLPEKLQEFIRQATKDGPLEFVYQPVDTWNTYWQSQNVDPREVANELLGSTAQYDEAVESGHDLQIPMDRYAVKIAPTEHNAFFAQELRFRPEQMNAREQVEFEKAVEENRPDAGVEDALATTQDPAAQVREDIVGQMVGQGFDQTSIDAYASMYESAFRAMGQRAGIDPFELYQRYGLKINRPLPEILKNIGKVDAIDAMIDRLRSGDVPKESELFGPTLIQFLKSKGGVKDFQGDLASREPDKDLKPFEKKLIQEKGIDLDAAREAAAEAGYIPPETSLTEFLDAIDDELRGTPVYSMINVTDTEGSPQFLAAQALNQLSDYLVQRGVDLNALSNEDIKKILNEAADTESTGDGVEFSQAPTVDSAEFKKWFRNSKAVEINGTPLVLNHQTHNDFDQFDRMHAVKQFGRSPENIDRVGIWFTDQTALYGPKNVRVYLSIQAPMILKDGGVAFGRDVVGANDAWSQLEEMRREAGSATALREKLKSEGYDGIMFDGTLLDGKKQDVWIAFESDQVRKVGTEFAQPAYHGSPHLFEKFSLQKIGTGEGHQAYGWGLYFAGAKEVAEFYKKNLTASYAKFTRLDAELMGGIADRDTPPVRLAEIVLAPTTSKLEALHAIESNRNYLGESGYSIAKDWIDSGEVSWPKREGRLYTVDIPEDSDYLDYDKPLSDQSPKVRSIIESLNLSLPDSPKGWQIYEAMADLRGNGYVHQGERGASETLAALGIPGIKYLDQDSRQNWQILSPDETVSKRWMVGIIPNGKREFFANESDARAYFATVKKETYNYIIFDDKLVDVIEYEQGDDTDKRGSIRFGSDRQFNIDLLKKADLSTFIHESGHFYLEVFGDTVEQISGLDPNSLSETQKQMQADYAAILNWMGVEARGKIGVDQHEQWARGLEAYMMEGKSPSPGLRQIFARFRSWLIHIYRSIAKLNVELTPEVRHVMDRLLATDEEIEAASKLGAIEPMFSDAAAAGMSEVEFKAYRELVQNASDEARDTVQAEFMREFQREQSTWWNRERDKVRAEVAETVHLQPVYTALSFLQYGKLSNGSPLPEGIQAFKLDKQALVDRYGEDFLKRLPRPYVYAREGGVHFDMAANILGFSSGDELVTALVNARNPKQLIEAETDSIMRERYGDLLLDGSLADSSRKAVLTAGRSEVIEAEMLALFKKRREVEPFTDAARADEKLKAREKRAAGIDTYERFIPTVDAVRHIAQRRVAAMKVRELQPGSYFQAARRASKAATEAALRGDFTTALAAKQRELISVEMFRAATEAKELADSTVQYMRSFTMIPKRMRIGKAGEDYLDQIDGLLERFDFSRVSQKIIERRRGLADWLNQKEQEGLPSDVPDQLKNEALRKSYLEMTIEELSGLRDTVKQIEHMARLKNRLLKSKAKRDLDEAVEEMVGSINAHSRGKKLDLFATRLPSGEESRRWSWLFASIRKMASLVREMDGVQDGGTMWNYITRPLNEAADIEAAMNEKAATRLNELFSAYKGRDLLALYDKSFDASLNVSITKMQRLMIALNWGNEDNRQRVMDGYRLSQQQIEQTLDRLDERDWKFVQGTLDFIDSYWPEIESKQKRVTGVAPEKVQASPIQTRFGIFRGGYFPLKYDDRKSGKVAANLESEFATIAQQAAYVRASTRRGHTKERVDNVKLPIRTDFGVIFEHVTQVIHDLSHHEMLLDVGRLLGQRKVQDAIYENYGDLAYKEMKGLLLSVAFGDVKATNGIEAKLGEIRRGVVIAGLGWSLTTSLLQPLGLSQSMVRVGPKWIVKGVKRWLTDAASMENSVRWISERSEFMRLRSKTQLREINEIRNTIGLNSGRLESWMAKGLERTPFSHSVRLSIADSYFWLIAKGQQIADVPTWLGAYEKAMDSASDESTAVALADQAVLDSQGGGQIKDLASAQRGSEALKIWTAFYSYFNVTWNLTVESVKRTNFNNPASIGRLAVDFLLLYSVPATLGMMLREAVKPGDDDDDETALRVMREHALYLIGLLPLLREFGGSVAGYGYDGPAGGRFFASASSLIQQAGQGEVDASMLRAANDTAGVLFHYPAGQVQRTLEGFMSLLEGETRNPAALLFGPPKN